MNLTELFNQQRKLDEEIERKHPAKPGEDRLAKKLLALSVELGECANEWRGFKFWSENQKANTWMSTGICGICAGTGTPIGIPDYADIDCWKCAGEGETNKNPLLEEYIDCLHFALSIGNDISFNKYRLLGGYQKPETTEKMFLLAQRELVYLDIQLDLHIEQELVVDTQYSIFLESILALGEMLGFTQEQIEQAYHDKNKTNWERQATGY